MEKTVSNIVE